MLIFCAQSVMPVCLFSATLEEGRYGVNIVFQKPKDPQEEQKIIHLKVEPELVSPIRLFYSRDVDLKKTSEADFVQIEFQDITSLTVVEQDLSKPMVATVIMTDGGALLMGYVVAEESFLNKELKLAGIFRSLDSVKTLTQAKDTEDSRNYALEYSKEYVWQGVRAGDSVVYLVTEDHPYRELIRVKAVHDSSIDLEVKQSGGKESKTISVDWKKNPVWEEALLKETASLSAITLNNIFIRELAEKKNLSVEVFEFKFKRKEGESFVLSVAPSLFPLTYAHGLNGVVQVRDVHKRIVRKLTEVNRLSVDEGKAALGNLSEGEKENLKTAVKNNSSELLSTLQKMHLRADNMDTFVAVDDLFIQLDGFPLAFSELKTVQEKIREMEEEVDERFKRLEEDLAYCQRKISELENFLKQFLPDQQRVRMEQDHWQWRQRLQMLENLRETSPEELKRQKREQYRERYEREGQSRRNVISNELSRFFQTFLPADIKSDQLMSLGRIRLISPTHATLSFPKSNVLIHLKLYGSTWKVCALVSR